MVLFLVSDHKDAWVVLVEDLVVLTMPQPAWAVKCQKDLCKNLNFVSVLVVEVRCQLTNSTFRRLDPHSRRRVRVSYCRPRPVGKGTWEMD